MKHTEQLFSVGVVHKETGEKLKLLVWAKNVDEATHKLTGALIGYDCEYRWSGSGPVYKNNQIVEREQQCNE